MNVTAIIVNRRTLELTKVCLESLLEFYPHIEVVLVDNRSGNSSTDYVKSVAAILPNVRCRLITSAVPHHATGLNAGLELVQTRYFLTLDSDVEVLRGEWIEEILGAFAADPKLFVIGHVSRNANRECIGPPRKGETGVDYVHPFCAMWDKKKFGVIGIRFGRTGQPACNVCVGAVKKGYRLGDLEGIHPHNRTTNLCVRHVWGGTRTVLAVAREKARRLRRGKKK